MFSLEMSAEQIGLRILAEQSRIPSDKLRKGELNERDQLHFHQLTKNTPIKFLF